jgi:hypothetical protein
LQRRIVRLLNFGSLFAFSTKAFLAIASDQSAARAGLNDYWSLAPEGHTQLAE